MKRVILCFVLVSLSTLFGCQSTTNSSETNTVETSQKSSYFSEAKTLLDKLTNEVEQGKKDQLHYFAPLSFKSALKSFNNATEEYVDIVQNGPSAFNVFKSEDEQLEQARIEIMDAINAANQNLGIAYKNKATAQEMLKDILTQKTMLTTIRSPKVFPKNFTAIDNRINDLIEYIDEGAVDKAQSKQAKLLADMLALEVSTVRKNFLGQLDADLAQIKDKDLAVDVPIIHQKLIDARNNADNIITITPRATTEIEAAVVIANFELAHLYHIAQEVSELNKLEDKDYEQYLLAKETLLHTVSEAMQTKDVRDLPVQKQVESIALQAGILYDKLEMANAAVIALQNDSAVSSEATQSLRTEFKSQLVNLNSKYDDLVIENSELNRQIQTQEMEIKRLISYKVEAMALAEQLKAKQEAEQKALAEQEKAKQAAEQKALAEQEKAKQEAEQKALVEQEKAKQAAEQKALAVDEKQVQAVESESTATEAALPIEESSAPLTNIDSSSLTD